MWWLCRNNKSHHKMIIVTVARIKIRPNSFGFISITIRLPPHLVGGGELTIQIRSFDNYPSNGRINVSFPNLETTDIIIKRSKKHILRQLNISLEIKAPDSGVFPEISTPKNPQLNPKLLIQTDKRKSPLHVPTPEFLADWAHEFMSWAKRIHVNNPTYLACEI